MRRLIMIIMAAALFVPSAAFAGVFDLTITVNPNTVNEDSYTSSYTSISDVIDNLDTNEIKADLPSYTDTSEASAILNFRGVPITLSIDQNSTTIRLSIPSIDVDESFTGTDRDDSVDKMEDWLKKNGKAAVTKLMKELVAETPTDPLAGNPASLESRMVALDYDYAVSPDETIEMNTKQSAEGSINANMISIFAKYSNYDLDGTSSSTYSLPMAYTFRFSGSKNSIAIRVPVSMVDIDGSKAYNFGLGLGLTYFVTDDWSLTPAIGYTAVGSVDLASVAQLISGSLTSSYSFHLGRYTLTMGNMIGHYKTIPFDYDDYSIDPDIQNTVLRNGLNLNIPTDGLIKGTSLELFVTDTRYYGSDLYVDQYNEFGLSYGFAKISQKKKGDKVYNLMRKLRVGVSYLTADNVSGYTVNFGYSF